MYLDVLKRREMVSLARNNLLAHERIHDEEQSELLPIFSEPQS